MKVTRATARSLRRRLFWSEDLESRRMLATVPAGFIDQPFGASVSSGTAIAFAPDGRMFALSQSGSVFVTSPDGTSTTTALTLAVNSFSERGLLGIAIDPNFATNNFVYCYYTELPAGADASTYSGSTYNRVSRFTVSGNTIAPASEQLVVRLDQLIAAGNHNGGALNFGPDGKLYICVGDNTDGRNAQSLSTRLGKLLRINSDGSIPSDNPTSFAGIAGTTTGDNRAIWAVGVRNPYSFNIAQDGRIFINEVGFDSFEEINLGQAGANYGWPVTEGGFDPAVYPDFTKPLYHYGHGGGVQLGYAITGGTYYSSTATQAFPAQYQDKYFFCDYGGGWISMIDPNSPPALPSSATSFATNASEIVGLKLGPDGGLYYLQRGGETAGVRRILPTTNFAPVITRQPEDLTVSIGEPATFSVGVNGTTPLSYQWQKNGANIPGATSSNYTINSATTSDNNTAYRVIVQNNLGSTTSSWVTLRVNTNTAPTPTITLPTGSGLFNGGQTISFAGVATDREDGTLAAAKLSWTIVFHHDTHTHPFLGPLDGLASGTFTIPTIGETSPNVWYRVILTATDSGGRTASVFKDIFPRTATFSLNTVGIPAGATLNLDAQPVPNGTATIGVVGVSRLIDAPLTQVINGQTYQFESWSDGGARTHTIVVPATTSVFTARYAAVIPSTNRASGKVTTTTGVPAAGVRIYLDPNWNSRFDTGEQFATSNATGDYSMDFLGTGTIHVIADTPTFTPAIGHWYSIGQVGDQRTLNFTVPDTVPVPIANRAIGKVTNTAGAAVAAARVYLDANFNSRLDAGELVVSSNATGDYTMNFPGTGTVHILIDGSAYTPSNGYWYNVTTAGEQRTLNFTISTVPLLNRVSGKVSFASGSPAPATRVYVDANFNSRFDAGEIVSATNTTGDYTLDFPGTGTMHVLIDGLNATPSNGYWYSVASAGDQRTCDFTVADVVPQINLPRVSGTIFADANGNGIRDAGELGLVNRQVLIDYNYNGIRDGNDVLVSTDANGNYAANGLRLGPIAILVLGTGGGVSYITIYADTNRVINLKG